MRITAEWDTTTSLSFWDAVLRKKDLSPVGHYENIRSIETMVCRVCGLTKAIDQFRLRSAASDLRVTICLPCMAVYQHQWYMTNRERLIAAARVRRDRAAAESRARIWAYLREHPCVDCGESDAAVLEFAHVRDKRAGVSQLVSNGVSWALIASEIEKCEVRCVNCHIRKTAREVGVYDRKAAFRVTSLHSAIRP
jgi:hypothetical protein